MNRYQIELAKLENRTPLFYYPYEVELKSERAKKAVAWYFFSQKTTYVLSFDAKKHVAEMLTEENLKKIGGKFTFHYNDPNESEGQRIQLIKHSVPKKLGNLNIEGFLHFVENTTVYFSEALEAGKDFEIVVGGRVDIPQKKKLTYDDLPDLMGVTEK